MLLRTILSVALVLAAGIGTLRASVLTESYPLLAGGMAILMAGLALFMRQDSAPAPCAQTA